MKKVLLLFAIAFVFNSSFAQFNKTWVGAAGGLWSVNTNWSPAVIPAATDTVIFNTNNSCNVDASTSIASLRIQALGVNLFSTSTNKTITINTNGAVAPVLHVSSGSSATFGSPSGTTGVSITTYGGAGVINNAQILGSLDFGLASTWTINNGTGITNVDVSGQIGPITTSTAATPIASSTVATLRFLSGSTLDWNKNGGNLPAADFQNGSTISITGVTNSMPVLNSVSNYNGLLTWSNPVQSITGAAAVLLPAANAVMDSIRVISTGSGTLRLFTEPNGYSLGHVEVQGGTLEMGAPLITNRTGTITTDLKILGGTVIGNATFTGESVTAGTPMSVFVGRHFTISGGTFNLTNRPSGGGGNGAFQLYVAGDITQTAGTITTTSAFGSQNQIALNGSAAQNLTMSTFSGPMSLVMLNTSTAGVTLLSNLTIPALPSALIFNTGVLRTSSTNLLTMAAGSAAFGATDASFVDGPVRKVGNTAFTFPVGKANGTFTGYVPIEISATVGPATDFFTAEYKHSTAEIYPVANPGIHHVSRVDYWILDRAGSTSNVDVTLYWTAISSSNGSPLYINNLAELIIASSNGTNWNTFGGLGTYGVSTVTAGSLTWSGLGAGAQFGPFSLASTTINNPLPIDLNYLNGFKQNGNHLLNWKVTCNNNAQATMTVERSADKQNFTAITSITASALRCLQPFDYADRTPLAGMNYYRLKMVDANGKVTYSSIIALLNKSAGFEIVNLVPSVVTNNAVLNITSAQKTKMDIVITDIAGKQVQKISFNLIAGSNQLTLNLAGLSAGSYQITGYTQNDSNKTIRFVKQ